MEFNIITICGEDTISREAGRKIRDLLLINWNEDRLILNFENRLIGSVSFFDEALALLLKKGSKTLKEIQNKLEFQGIRKEDRELLNYVFASRVKEWETKSKAPMARSKGSS